MKNKKWYIVIKYWFDENDYNCRLNHWTILTNDKDYDKIKAYNELFSLRPLGNMLVGHRDFNVSLEDLEQYDLRRNQTT